MNVPELITTKKDSLGKSSLVKSGGSCGWRMSRNDITEVSVESVLRSASTMVAITEPAELLTADISRPRVAKQGGRGDEVQVRKNRIDNTTAGHARSQGSNRKVVFNQTKGRMDDRGSKQTEGQEDKAQDAFVNPGHVCCFEYVLQSHGKIRRGQVKLTLTLTLALAVMMAGMKGKWR